MISNRYFPSIALKADKTSELYNFVSFVNLVKRILSSTHAAAFLLFSNIMDVICNSIAVCFFTFDIAYTAIFIMTFPALLYSDFVNTSAISSNGTIFVIKSSKRNVFDSRTCIALSYV